MIIKSIENELDKHIDKENAFKIGYIKEYLQTLVLREIYETPECKDIVFYGGTALRFLFDLNRLSEDLDFVSADFNDFELLGEKLQKFFKSQNIKLDFKIQKFRLTLKFRNLLEKFDIKYGNSNDLYIKIEISDNIDFCKKLDTKIYPIFRFNHSLIIKSLNKETLFASKLNAVLERSRIKKIGENEISVKGRDFYDLFRYLNKNIKPNIDCIPGVKDLEDLKNKLKEKVNNTDFKEVIIDIKNFVEDNNIIEFIENHGKEYILEKIEEWE
ncbi:MAG TPA: nucleotidyl transferase AbiEii/AbiGii toxin family protein [Candidatus Absconditabacterales bacterium]|nr:nucleotidyl transferase AbiEii/AbiGii toxin family protein [Candidatus Absconditabacterales bacterium]